MQDRQLQPSVDCQLERRARAVPNQSAGAQALEQDATRSSLRTAGV